MHIITTLRKSKYMSSLPASVAQRARAVGAAVQ